MTIAEKVAALGYPDAFVRELPDGRAAWVHRLLYTCAILVGDPDEISYDDRWCYETRADAVAALQRWNPETEAEPTGWHRNPRTGRRRPQGDPAKEYVNL